MTKIPETMIKPQAAAVRERIDHFEATNTPDQIEAHRRHCRGERFRDDEAAMAEDRALMILIYSEASCAGCRFFLPDGRGSRRGWCRRTNGRTDGSARHKATDWCGKHVPLLGGVP